MVVDDSMDEGVDVYCGIWPGGEVEFTILQQSPTKPIYFYAHNYGIRIHKPAINVCFLCMF
jgi:hypothetical protein